MNSKRVGWKTCIGREMDARLAQATLTLCASMVRTVLSGLITARIEVAMLIVALGYNLRFLALISMNLSSIRGMK